MRNVPSLDKSIINAINPQQQAHIYRIIQEGLTNIEKHSKPKNVSIKITIFGPKKQLRIELINDGIKKDAKKNFDRGVGLMSIEERVSQLNGHCKISVNRVFKITIDLGITH